MDEKLEIKLPEIKELGRLTREARELIEKNNETESLKELETELENNTD